MHVRGGRNEFNRAVQVCGCVCAAAVGVMPELFEEIDISRRWYQFDEVFVGGSVGVGFLLLLSLLLPLLQLRQQHPVYGVWIAEDFHQRLQHCNTNTQSYWHRVIQADALCKTATFCKSTGWIRIDSAKPHIEIQSTHMHLHLRCIPVCIDTHKSDNSSQAGKDKVWHCERDKSVFVRLISHHPRVVIFGS